MRKLILIILAAIICLPVAATAVDFTVKERKARISSTRAPDGTVMFVIASQDPVRAIDTLEDAEATKELGKRVSVLFMGKGVLLVSSKDHSVSTFGVQEEKPLTKNPKDDESIIFKPESAQPSLQPIDIKRKDTVKGKAATAKKKASSQVYRGRRAEAAAAYPTQSELKRRIDTIVENISANNNVEVMACPICMKMFGVKKADLVPYVKVAPLPLVNSIHKTNPFEVHLE